VQASKANHLQVRYFSLHPSKIVINCDAPERWRWAKAPREVRILRKVWLADDLARKSRTQIKPAETVRTPIASLGLTPHDEDAGASDAGPDAGADSAEAASDCGCRFPGTDASGSGALLAALALLGSLGRRRRASLPESDD
jgi:MYXO-CTERM domain-containing protein